MDEQLEALILNWQSTKAAIDELIADAGIEILQELREAGVYGTRISNECGISRSRQQAIMNGAIMTPDEYLSLCRITNNP